MRWMRAIARRNLVLQRLEGMDGFDPVPPGAWDGSLQRFGAFLASLDEGVLRWLPTEAGSEARKRWQIRLAIPEFAARIYCLMEMGFELESAVGIVILEHPRRDRAFKSEWFRYLQEVRMGATREDGLKRLKNRMPVPELAELVGSWLSAGEDAIALRQQCRESIDRLTRMAPRSQAFWRWILAFELLAIALLAR